MTELNLCFPDANHVIVRLSTDVEHSSRELLREKKADTPNTANSPPNIGYLCFEDADGHTDFVSAERLGANLHRHKVGLVILSACQSAAVEKQDASAEKAADEADAQKKPAMGSVAARLTATGIPSVLAMTHSVLVATTRALFGQFYQELARHRGIGEALDNARRHLANHPEKYEVQRYDAERGPYRKKLVLHDWFLPALYQPGADGPLLKKLEAGSATAEASPPRSNLKAAPEAGFFGRKRPSRTRRRRRARMRNSKTRPANTGASPATPNATLPAPGTNSNAMLC